MWLQILTPRGAAYEIRLSPAQAAGLDVDAYVWLLQGYMQQAESLLLEATCQPEGRAARQLQVLSRPVPWQEGSSSPVLASRARVLLPCLRPCVPEHRAQVSVTHCWHPWTEPGQWAQSVQMQQQAIGQHMRSHNPTLPALTARLNPIPAFTAQQLVVRARASCSDAESQLRLLSICPQLRSCACCRHNSACLRHDTQPQSRC